MATSSSLEKPCTNHDYPVKHKLKDCELLKRILGQPSKRKGGDRDKEAPKDQEAPAKNASDFPDLDGCLMIFGGPEDDCSKRQHKVRLREVCSAKRSIPNFSVGRALQSLSIGLTTHPSSAISA
jgi:hypothetical protein